MKTGEVIERWRNREGIRGAFAVASALHAPFHETNETLPSDNVLFRLSTEMVADVLVE